MEILKVLVMAALTLMAGGMVMRHGVIQGRISVGMGAFDVEVWGRQLVGEFVQFRPGKVYYRLMVSGTQIGGMGG